jgi:hypothetical protein
LTECVPTVDIDSNTATPPVPDSTLTASFWDGPVVRSATACSDKGATANRSLHGGRGAPAADPVALTPSTSTRTWALSWPGFETITDERSEDAPAGSGPGQDQSTDLSEFNVTLGSWPLTPVAVAFGGDARTTAPATRTPTSSRATKPAARARRRRSIRATSSLV